MVEALDDHTFQAIFVDVQKIEYIADIRYDEFPAHDRKYLKPGMPFRWWVWCYDDDKAMGHSTFKIRKYFWKQKDIDQAKEWAKQHSQLFDGISSPDGKPNN